MLEKNDIKHPSALPYSYHTFMLAFSFDYDISDTEGNRGNCAFELPNVSVVHPRSTKSDVQQRYDQVR